MDDRDDRDRDDEGPADRRARRAEPPRRRSVWPFVLAIGCGILVLCAGGGGALVYWAYNAFTRELQPAQAAADRFLDALKDGQVDAAYEQTGAGFRRGQSRDEFAAHVRRFETLTRHTARTTNGARLFQGPGGKRVLVQVTLTAPNNATTCTLTLVDEGGAWKVDKLTVP